jgi:RNA polymerase sigma factor (sigma-70 family)
MDLKRRQRFRHDSASIQDKADTVIDRQVSPEVSRSEEALIELLNAALRRVWGATDREQLLMLRLVHLHDLSQREIARMWGWHESKVSRTLETARSSIAKGVLAEVNRADPWLRLEWQDFAELCAGATDLFSLPARN